MKIAFFGTQKVWGYPAQGRGTHQWSSFIQKYDINSFNAANPEGSDLEFTFLDALLDKSTAQLAVGHDAVCIFVNDTCDEPVLQKLSALGVVCWLVHYLISIQLTMDFYLEIYCTKVCGLQQRRHQGSGSTRRQSC